jgi:hypothetical protein
VAAVSWIGPGLARHVGFGAAAISHGLPCARGGCAGRSLPRAAVGIDPGPELGRLIFEVEAGVFTGEVRSREDASELARKVRAGLAPKRSASTRVSSSASGSASSSRNAGAASPAKRSDLARSRAAAKDLDRVTLPITPAGEAGRRGGRAPADPR